MRYVPVFLAGLVSFVIPATAQIVVFSSTLDSSMPPEIAPGVALLEGVQGYAGLGPVGDQFGGTFLRSPTGNLVTLSLTSLPEHDSISIDFLFAAIDSLDGTGAVAPEGDFFSVTLDGNIFFRESFANARLDQIQSYIPPPGGELARHVDLGFVGPGTFFTDSAYDMGIDPVFASLPHSAPTATLTFQIEGPGIQGLADESWGIDNLTVTVSSPCPVDINGDGILDNGDIGMFVSLFLAGDLAADMNGDGILDNGDIGAFVILFLAGC